MEDWSIPFVIVWVGSFAVVAMDSAYKKISPFFWRVASLFGGPFALIAYGIIREKQGK